MGEMQELRKRYRNIGNIISAMRYEEKKLQFSSFGEYFVLDLARNWPEQTPTKRLLEYTLLFVIV